MSLEEQLFCLLFSGLFFLSFTVFLYPMFLFTEKWFFTETNWNFWPRYIFYQYAPSLFRIGSRQLHMLSFLGFFKKRIELLWLNNFSSWIRQKSWSAMWAVVTLVFFSGFSTAFCSFNTKEKDSADPDSNQGPKDVFLYYSPPLYQLSYRQVYMSSVCGICL